MSDEGKGSRPYRQSPRFKANSQGQSPASRSSRPQKSDANPKRTLRDRMDSAWVKFGSASTGLGGAVAGGMAGLAAGGPVAGAATAAAAGFTNTVLNLWHTRGKSRADKVKADSAEEKLNKRVGDQTARLLAAGRDRHESTHDRLDALESKLDDMKELRSENKNLRSDNRGLRSENKDLRAQNQALEAQLKALGVSTGFTGPARIAPTQRSKPSQAPSRSTAPRPPTRRDHGTGR